MERQFKIGASPYSTLLFVHFRRRMRFPVQPDATPEEVRAVVDDSQGGQIFSQAVRLVLLFCLALLNLY